MKLPPRVVFIVLVVVLSVAGASYAHPSWPTDLGLDFWHVPALKNDLARQHRLQTELYVQDAQVLRRIATKEQVITAVIADRMGLLDAAARFYALNAGKAKLMAELREAYPSA